MTYLKTGLMLAALTAVSGCYNEYNRDNDNVLVKGNEYNLETGVKRVPAADPVASTTPGTPTASNAPL